ncbi:MAG: alpha/beta fold hydrolase [Planctomycetota bacterium]
MTDPLPPSKLSLAIGRLALSAGRYPGRRYVGAMHRRLSRGRGGRRFKVVRPHGITLDAWFSPALPQTRELSPASGRTDARLPVVIAHGLMETKERHFKQAWKLNARGHDVVLFDHRVHGRSTGRRLTFGVEEKHDLTAVIDEAHRRGWIGDRVITLGFSLGGATVLQHAAIDPRVAGVVALAPFADFRGAINSFRRTLTPWLDEKWLMDGFDAASAEAGFTVDEASAIKAFKEITVPVLLAEGGRDPFLPGVDHVHKLAASKSRDDQRGGHAGGSLEQITLVRIEQANHNTLVHRHWPKLDRAIARFCRKVSAASACSQKSPT